MIRHPVKLTSYRHIIERGASGPTLFEIVFEDEDLLLINKPAGLVCHPTKGDVFSSLISRIRLYLGPDVPAHLINRLDRETSGLVLVAKSTKAASELRRLWEQRRVRKEYQAIVHGALEPLSGSINMPLGHDPQSQVSIKDCVRPDGAPAQTEFERLELSARTEGVFSLVRLRPCTGRKHQLRIHLAYLGHPIVGDKLYGGDEQLYLDFVHERLTPEQWQRLVLRNHALHAGLLEFDWRGGTFRFEVAPEEEFREFWGADRIGQEACP